MGLRRDGLVRKGLYLPVYSVADGEGPVLDGFKVRELFVVPHAADRTFFYGINFEFSYNSQHWDPYRYTSEIRPILGWHLGKFDFIVNPILDNSWTGIKNLDFAPSVRVAYNVDKTWAVAAELYSDWRDQRPFAVRSAVATDLRRPRLQDRAIQHRSRARLRFDARLRSIGRQAHDFARPVQAAAEAKRNARPTADSKAPARIFSPSAWSLSN